ncbi:MAG: hypothetical protein IKK53_04485, partial [Ruminiclostridium sp.]|nr:hypothetical protein [Ruminiclostridium sp.]
FKPDRVNYPVRLKLKLKVFGKESEEKPFYKRVFLSNACKASIRISTLYGMPVFSHGKQIHPSFP